MNTLRHPLHIPDLKPRAVVTRIHRGAAGGVVAVDRHLDRHRRRARRAALNVGERRATGHTAGTLAVTAMPDGQRLLSGAADKTVRVWLLDGTLVNTFELRNNTVLALVALPDNQHALSGSTDKTVKLFNVNDGDVLRTFAHHAAFASSLALLPDGLRFVSGSYDKTARIVYHGLAASK